MAWTDDVTYRFFPPRSSLLIRVVEAGYGHLDEWWRLARVRMPHWTMYVNQDLGAELVLGGGDALALAPGKVWFLPPWLEHGRLTRRRVRHLWVEFDLVGLSPHAVAARFRRPMSLDLDARLKASCATLRRSARDAACGDAQVLFDAHAVACAGVAMMLARQSPADLHNLVPGADHQDIAPALRRIESALDGPIYNESLARLCGLSIPFFCRRFRAALGQSPAQYIIDRRIALAAELLLTGTQPIEAIATACGFADRFTFSRMFTRRVGRSPAAYRDGRSGSEKT